MGVLLCDHMDGTTGCKIQKMYRNKHEKVKFYV